MKLSKDKTVIIVVYILAYGSTLLNNGLYWDDWTLYHVPAATIIKTFMQNGSYWPGPLHVALLALPYNIMIYRIIVLLAFLACTFLVYELLRTIKQIDSFSRMVITTLFAIYPVNAARELLITLPYALCNLAFFIGFWLLACYMIYGKIRTRVLALLCFLFAFFTNSILVFYSIVLIYIYYIERQNPKPKSLLGMIKAYLDFLIIPVLFGIIKLVFLKPYGIYKGYDSVNLHGFLALNRTLLTGVYNSFPAVIHDSMSNLSLITLFFWLAIAIGLFKLLGKSKASLNWPFVIFGIFALIIGILPYCVVNKLPSPIGWETRNELLVPLGASFIIYYIIKMILDKVKAKTYIAIAVYALIIAVFVGANIHNADTYQRDWYKQLALIENFKHSSVIRDNTTFLFDDHTPNLSVPGTSIGFYEYNGMMKLAFGDQTRFGERITMQFKDLRDYARFIPYEEYNMKDYKIRPAQFIVTVLPGNYNISSYRSLFKLEYLQFFNPIEFKKDIRELVKLQYVKL
ncbi:MAG: hypothetical protein M0Z55_06905 [Peptococcaceae bacterium]|nr:hypothetical protein [Peptococcaceae bacterium]